MLRPLTRHPRIVLHGIGLMLLACLSMGISGCGGSLAREMYVCNQTSAPHVEVLRGSVGIFPGLEGFQEALAQRGIATTISYPEGWRNVADRLIARRHAGDCSPIVLVGYSKGATASIHIAHALQAEGIDVDAIIILEGCHHRLIPANVHYCFNSYLPYGVPRMRGLPVSGECSSTVIDNYDLVANDPSGHMGELRHLNLTYDSCVHDLLAEKILYGYSGAACRR